MCCRQEGLQTGTFQHNEEVNFDSQKKKKGFAFSVSASEQQNYFKENVVYLSLA